MKRAGLNQEKEWAPRMKVVAYRKKKAPLSGVRTVRERRKRRKSSDATRWGESSDGEPRDGGMSGGCVKSGRCLKQ